MNRFALITIVFCLVSSTAIAQPQRGGGPPPGGNPAAHLTGELGLDEQQSAQVAAVFEEAHAMREGVEKQSHELHCEIRAYVDEQLMAIFTADQQTRFQELLANRSEPKSGNGGQARDGDDRRQKRGPPPECEN